MGKHQTGDTGMRFHSTTLREADANLFHIQQFIEHEVQTGIRQGWIAYSRTDALKLFYLQFSDREVFVLGIAPIALPHFLVHPLGCGLSQTICQELHHHLLIGVCVEIGFESVGDGSGEKADFRGKRKEKCFAGR